MDFSAIFNTAKSSFNGLSNETWDRAMQKAERKQARQERKEQGGDVTSALNNFNGNFSGWGTIVGSAASSIGSAIGNKYNDSFSAEQQASQDVIRSGLAMIPGWGQAIAAASGVVDAIGSMTGTNLSNIDKNAAKKAGLGGAAMFNNTMNMLPGNSMIWGLMGQRSNAYKLSDQAEELSAGYNGTVDNMRAAEGVANKRLLFGQGRANAYIDQQKKNEQILHQLNETNTMHSNPIMLKI